MKKWAKWGIVLLCAVIIAFGVRSIAGESQANEASPTVTGTVKTIDSAHDQLTVTTDDGSDKTIPISKTVWVFLNDHKAQISDIGAGVKVELILNAKNQAAYIKAVTLDNQSSGAEPTVSPSPSSNPNPSPTPNPNVSATPSTMVPTVADAPWTELHIKIEGKDFNMDIHDKGDQNNGTSMIKMTPKGRDGFLLKGDAAEHWIRTLLSGIDLKAPNAQQQVSTAFANWFELNGISLNVKIEVEAKEAKADRHDDDEQGEDDGGKPGKKDQNKQDKGSQSRGKADEKGHAKPEAKGHGGIND
ncbi:hypothetical protein [Paenibacillus cymbidii]|uniref:hypothetical protein n=1 Tax=Paenibacillus cymbidii TaxID=1639034 RepID=UPI0010817615|nr:hypothetical protein [Paenibacillus cymbidii]